MPIIDLEPQRLADAGAFARPENAIVTPAADEVTDRPPINELVGASFRQENIIGSAIASQALRETFNPSPPDPNFRAFDQIKGTPYEQHWERFVDTQNQAQFDAVRNDIDRETNDRKTIAASPWYVRMPLALTANVLDPTMLVPGAEFVKGARGGISVARAGIDVGVAMGLATAVQEAGLQATQQTRTLGESAIDIGSSALLGGFLGAGGAALLSKGGWEKAVKTIDGEVSAAPTAEKAMAPGDVSFGNSIGAAAVTAPTLAQTEIAGRAAGTLAYATQRLNPGLRLAHSESADARDVAANLFEMSTYIRGNEDGLASPVAVETFRKQWNAGLMSAIEDTQAAYGKYRAGPDAGLNRTAFYAEIGRAMRRDDESAIPEVAAAAKSWRNNVFDPLKVEAVNAKLLPEDVAVDTAVSYFSRLWNRKRLIGEEPLFKQTVRDWVTGNYRTWEASFDAETRAGSEGLEGQELAKYMAKRELQREERFNNNPVDVANDVANEVYNVLTGRDSEGVRPEFITVKARGPLKERTFNIPDELVERWLESDVEQVGRRYSRIMSADVELARKFGSPDMGDQIKKIQASYDRLRVDVTDEKRLVQLRKQEGQDIKDIQGVRDIIRGTYGQAAWERDFGAIVRQANAIQYVLKMGQVVLSSLTEPVRVAAAQGILPTIGTAFSALANLGAVKMSVKEARLAGNINDKILAARLSTLADIGDFYGSRTPVEKFLDNMTNVASTWNGIRIWTDGVKMLASTMIQNKVLDFASRFGEIGAKDKRYLAFLGIDESMAERIAKQFAEHGQVQNGVHVAGTADWTDEVARRTYRAAINKDIDSMVVTRGAADVPLFANTPMGRMLLQFNTFNLASHQRMLVRGLQEGPARFLSGAVAMSAMGMLQTYLAALATNSTNRLPSIQDNPGWWISEGLDKSGLFSVPFQLANGVEKLTGVNPIKSPIKAWDVGNTISQKNRNRNELGVLGPTAGTVQDIGSVAGMIKNAMRGEDITKAQKNAAERLLPFNSYYGTRQLLKYFINPPQE